jgi:hypothetical protein
VIDVNLATVLWNANYSIEKAHAACTRALAAAEAEAKAARDATAQAAAAPTAAESDSDDSMDAFITAHW